MANHIICASAHHVQSCVFVYPSSINLNRRIWALKGTLDSLITTSFGIEDITSKINATSSQEYFPDVFPHRNPDITIMPFLTNTKSQKSQKKFSLTHNWRLYTGRKIGPWGDGGPALLFQSKVQKKLANQSKLVWEILAPGFGRINL